MSVAGKTAVMFGGVSAEREVSLRSGKAVLTALLDAGVDAVAFDPKSQSLAELSALNVSRVFIVLHGRGGEDGSMQGALQLLGLPYTGSGVLGSALAMDKIRCKWLFQAQNLPTSPFAVVHQGQNADYQTLLAELGGKVMVKPANEGSSIGMSAASTAEELAAAIETALQYDTEVLVERWINGREFTIAILNGRVLPVVEMRTPRAFYDYEAKYQADTTEYLCPAPLTEQQTAAMQQTALAAFNAVGAKGWGRVDLMLDQQGQHYLLEVNTVPGMTEKSLVPMAAKASGLSFQQLVLEILQQAE